MPGLDSATIRHLLEVARKRGYSSVEASLDGERLSAKLGPDFEDDLDLDLDMGSLASVTPDQSEVSVPSPAVGYFRTNQKAAQIGSEVAKGDLIGEVVALGIANEILSPTSGVLAEVLAKNGDALEYGQTVAKVNKQ
ncbi:MAG: hypothetical protein MUC92_03945 [Fimbriimonadaceae bacterium]|jgi:biotin carboxyl carrier protein|nr:hypothetical protein [Fimbriimonadaceae bacterium]